MSDSRAERRHRTRTIHARRQRMLKEPDRPHVHGSLLETPANCSCYMCGNARKWWKSKPIQQIKLEQDLEE